jgi:hypothetical protein
MESIKTLMPYLRESKGSLLSPNITMVFPASIPVRAPCLSDSVRKDLELSVQMFVIV